MCFQSQDGPLAPAGQVTDGEERWLKKMGDFIMLTSEPTISRASLGALAEAKRWPFLILRRPRDARKLQKKTTRTTRFAPEISRKTRGCEAEQQTLPQKVL